MGCCGGADFLESLEGVESTCGLALRGPQVGLHPPAVAAVGISVGVQGGERSVDVRLTEEQRETPAIEHAGVHLDEVGCGVDIEGSAHAVTLADRPSNV